MLARGDPVRGQFRGKCLYEAFGLLSRDTGLAMPRTVELASPAHELDHHHLVGGGGRVPHAGALEPARLASGLPFVGAPVLFRHGAWRGWVCDLRDDNDACGVARSVRARTSMGASGLCVFGRGLAGVCPSPLLHRKAVVARAGAGGAPAGRCGEFHHGAESCTSAPSTACNSSPSSGSKCLCSASGFPICGLRWVMAAARRRSAFARVLRLSGGRGSRRGFRRRARDSRGRSGPGGGSPNRARRASRLRAQGRHRAGRGGRRAGAGGAGMLWG